MSLLQATATCPECGFERPLIWRVRWGYQCGGFVRDVYFLGDPIQWRRCPDGSVPGNTRFLNDPHSIPPHGGSRNQGTTEAKAVKLALSWARGSSATCPNCEMTFSGAVADIEDGVIERLRIVPTAVFGATGAAFTMGEDGKWDLFRREMGVATECGRAARRVAVTGGREVVDSAGTNSERRAGPGYADLQPIDTFVMGRRFEALPLDFDGQVRRVDVLRTLRPADVIDPSVPGQRTLWLVRLTPPVDIEGQVVDVAAMNGVTFEVGWAPSQLWEIRDHSGIDDGVYGRHALDLLEVVDLAREASLLPPPPQEFDRYTAALESFRKREGHCRMPIDYHEAGLSLGRWLYMEQRRPNEGSPVSPRREQVIEELTRGGRDSEAWPWISLEAYVRSRGTSNLEADEIARYSVLGTFVAHLRSRGQQLGPVKVARLEALPDWHW